MAFVQLVITSVLICNDMLVAAGVLKVYLGAYNILVFIIVQSVINYSFQEEIEKEHYVMKLLVDQKEMMLKEVHHRVKNNFQIVSSLLEMQSKDITDEKARQLANDGQNRLKSMAFIHQKLYKSDSGLINFNDYLRKLIQEISSAYKSQKGVEIQVTIQDIELDIDTAVPLGLIVNEIITNAYKYAFEGVAAPLLSVSIEETTQNNYVLEIKDNGIGFDKNVDVEKANSIGLRLIKGLVKQLNGAMEVFTHNGTTFRINFKNTLERKLVD